MLDHIFIQFAKLPELGNVKTRLSPAIGDEACLQLHIQLLTHTHKLLQQAQQTLGGMSVLSLGKIGDDPLVASLAQQTPLMVQQGSDLGERMGNAIEWGLTLAKKVIIVGSDCPVLSLDYLSDALQALDEEDHVFINAEDGGYVLVGARKPCLELFQNVPWGSEYVMEKTLLRLQENHKKAVILGPLWDVDREEDYERLRLAFPEWPDII